MNEENSKILYRAKVNYERNRGNGVPWDELTDSCMLAWLRMATREIATGEGIWTQEDFDKLRE